MSKQVDWKGEVAAWRASGQTARRFCEGRGYTATRLYWWSSQMKRSDGSTSRMPPVPMARVVRERSRPASARVPIVIRVGNAHVEVSGEVDRATLLVVMQTLTDASLGGAP